MKFRLSLLIVSVFLLWSCDDSPVSTDLTATGDATVAHSEQAAQAPAQVTALSESQLEKRISDAEYGGRPLTADLNGANEVPAEGDPDGSGSALITLNQGQGEVCFELTVADIAAPTGAHIHAAPAGVNGGVVIPLLPPPEDGSVSGCVSDVDKDLIKSIRQSPSDYYVNVHNPDFPGGAVRGQLSK